MQSKFDKAYVKLLDKLLTTEATKDPKRASVFRLQTPVFSTIIPVDGFIPLLQCKKTFLASAVNEFNFFMGQDMNISKLKGSFWNDDAYNYYCRLCLDTSDSGIAPVEPVNKEAFLKLLGEDCWYLKDYRYGDLGPVYGTLWKEQLPYIIKQLEASTMHTDMLVLNTDHRVKDNPLARALAPCHYSWQVVGINEDSFALTFEMRSCDVFLGLPMNVLFYFIMGKYLEYRTGKKFKQLIPITKSVHLYCNSIDAVSELLEDSINTPNTLLVRDDIISFSEYAGNYSAVLEQSLDLQEYNNTAKHYKVEMLAQTNSLL